MSELPHGWRSKPQRLEHWLNQQFPTMEFVCQYFKMEGDWFMSIKTVETGDYARLRYHRYILAAELARPDGADGLIAQLWLASP